MCFWRRFMKKGRSGKDMTVSLIFPERQTIPTQPATGSVVLGGDEEVSRGIGRRSLQNPADSVCPDSQDKEAQTADDSGSQLPAPQGGQTSPTEQANSQHDSTSLASTTPDTPTRKRPNLELWIEARDRIRASDDWKSFENEVLAFEQNKSQSKRTEDTILHELMRAKEQCEREQWGCTVGGVKIIYRDKMDKIVAWARAFGQLGAAVTSLDPTHHAGMAWSGVQFFIEAATREKEIRDIVLEQETIAHLISRYAIFEMLYLDSETLSETQNKLRESLVELYERVLKYQAEALKYLKSGIGRRTMRSFRPTTDHPVNIALGKINQQKLDVDAFQTLDDRQFALNLRGDLFDKLEQLEQPIVRMGLKIEYVEDKLDERERMEALNWISRVPIEDHHFTIANAAMKGSGQWLLQHPEFKEWRKSSGPSLFWLHGMVGAGKSTLVSIVIDYLSSRCTAENGERLAYFYCNQTERSSDLKNTATILQSVVLQLSDDKSKTLIMDSVMQLYKRKRGMGGLNDTECVETVVKLTNQYPLTTIVIDALDEYEDIEIRYSVMVCLQKILEDSKGLVKIFVSSRNLVDIENQMKAKSSMIREVGMRAENTREDIQRFVDEQLANYIQRRRLLNGEVPDDLKKEINTKLCQGAQGMFKWVQLSLQTLRDAGQPQVVRNLLNRLPKKLEDLYEIIFQSIRNYHQDDLLIVERALKWLLYGEVPLYTSDFLEESLLKLCRNLVEEEKDLDHFRLAHLSVKEFLEKKHGYVPNQGHSLIGETCILHLCSIGIDAFKDFHELGRFTGYAVVYWRRHCKMSTGGSGEEIIKLLRNRAIFEVNEAMIAAAAYRFTPGMVDVLLKASSASMITDMVWKAAAGNEQSGKEIIELLSRNSKIRVTREILDAAARNLRSGEGVMSFLFGNGEKRAVKQLLGRREVEITKGMVVALAHSTDAEMMELALSKNKHYQITTADVEAARENEQYGAEVLNLLLSKSDGPVLERRVSTVAGHEVREQELAELFLRGPMTISEYRRRLKLEDEEQAGRDLFVDVSWISGFQNIKSICNHMAPRFGRILLFVVLPNHYTGLSSFQYLEVFEIFFDWLWYNGARRIMKVIIWDNKDGPYSEELIERFLVRFEVVEVVKNWNQCDGK